MLDFSKWSLAVAAIAVACAAMAPSAEAIGDRMRAPDAVPGEETQVFVKPDATAGQFSEQRFDVFGNGSLVCDEVDLRGAIFAPIVGHVPFRSVRFGACSYLGMNARLNTASCEVEITSGGLGRFMDAKSGSCNVRIEAPGCTIHLGKGPFIELGYHNEGNPREITALTEPDPIVAKATGALCPSPGPEAIVQYHGYLKIGGARDGKRVPFTVII